MVGQNNQAGKRAIVEYCLKQNDNRAHGEEMEELKLKARQRHEHEEKGVLRAITSFNDVERNVGEGCQREHCTRHESD